jgi:hypothetical protein
MDLFVRRETNSWRCREVADKSEKVIGAIDSQLKKRLVNLHLQA